MEKTNQTSSEFLEINESNFGDYFFDVRFNKPQRGQVMACYSAMVEFLDGPEKRQIIEFMCTSDQVEASRQVLRKALMAREKDAVRILREMVEDMLDGKSEDEVATKPYKMACEWFYWTHPELLPRDDPHWSCVSILNLDEYFAKKGSSKNPIITIESVKHGEDPNSESSSSPTSHPEKTTTEEAAESGF